MAGRRLLPPTRLLGWEEKPCNGALQHGRHMATFISREGNSTPAQNAATMTGYASGLQADKVHAFQRAMNACSPNPEVPNLRADVRRADPLYGGWDPVAGNVSCGAASASSYADHMNQAEQVHARQRAHHNAQGEHVKVNAGALNQNHVGHPPIRGVNAPPHDRPLIAHAPSQDPAITSANAAALHQDTMGLMKNRGVNAGIVKEHPMTPQHDTGSLRHSSAVNHGSLSEPHVGSLLYSNAPSKIPHNVTPMQQGKLLGMTPASKEYIVSKARIHAALWQQEILKLAGDVNEKSDLASDLSMQSLHAGDDHRRLGFEAKKGTPEGWEMFDPPEAHFYNDSPAKEEAMMYEEFERRRERNRVLIAGFVKQHLYGRRRPVDGWKHIINCFGIQSKTTRDSTLESKESQTTRVSELEKLAQKQERRQLVLKR